MLSRFKEEAPESGVLVLLRDVELQNFLVAWSASAEKACAYYDVPAKTLDELWSVTEVDIHAIACVLRTYESDTQRLFESAKRLNLIFPDGSLLPRAKQILDHLLVTEIRNVKSKNK